MCGAYLGRRGRPCPNPRMILFYQQWAQARLSVEGLSQEIGISRAMGYEWINLLRTAELSADGLPQVFRVLGRPPKKVLKASTAYASLCASLGRPPTPKELAAKVGITERYALTLCKRLAMPSGKN